MFSIKERELIPVSGLDQNEQMCFYDFLINSETMVKVF